LKKKRRKIIRPGNKRIKKQRLEEELTEGYRAKAKLNLKISKDFKYVDGKNI
jgi:hypothetical protein